MRTTVTNFATDHNKNYQARVSVHNAHVPNTGIKSKEYKFRSLYWQFNSRKSENDLCGVNIKG